MIIWGVFFDSIINVWQFDRVLNAPRVFYEIAILHVYWRPLVSKLRVVSLQRYCKNSQRISWKFSNFLQNSYFPKLWTTASDLTKNYYYDSAFLVQFLLKRMFMSHLHVFRHIWWKIIALSWNYKILISTSCFLMK